MRVETIMQRWKSCSAGIVSSVILGLITVELPDYMAASEIVDDACILGLMDCGDTRSMGVAWSTPYTHCDTHSRGKYTGHDCSFCMAPCSLGTWLLVVTSA